MNYTYNLLEDYIRNLYHTLGIFHPHQLNLENIAYKLGFTIVYYPIMSLHVREILIIDSRGTPQQRWQDFGHELCHALIHEGNQNVMPSNFRLYQEWKAENFSQHFCIPTFMLERIKFSSDEAKTIYLIQETFNVDYEFAKKRLNQYILNLQSIG